MKVGYPTREEERLIAENNAHPEYFPQAMTVASLADITAARKMVDRIYMDPKLLDYVLDIVFATRPKNHSGLSERQDESKLAELIPLIQYGASPRATISLVLASKALAFMEGRAYVIPQDVKEVAHDVLRHRIMLSYEAEAEDMTADDVITKILEELKTP